VGKILLKKMVSKMKYFTSRRVMPHEAGSAEGIWGAPRNQLQGIFDGKISK
jgi:hypothetical protein